MEKNGAIGHTWEEVRKEFFTPKEIAASDKRVARMSKAIEQRLAREAARRESSGQAVNQNVAVVAKGA